MNRSRPSALPVIAWAAFSALVSGCEQRIDVGSSVLWTAGFESGGLDEWTGVDGGGTSLEPSSSAIVVASEHAHHGSFAAKMTVTATRARSMSTLDRNGNLPEQGYYSAWFYLPEATSVSNTPPQQYWSLMRFRGRAVVTDSKTMFPIYDINLKSLASGAMSLRVYDVVLSQDAPMIEEEPLVPLARWFQVEAFYRNAPDATGRLSLWLDGTLVADIAKATGPSGWVGWSVANVIVGLSTEALTLYTDDCALSQVRVGPTGLLSTEE